MNDRPTLALLLSVFVSVALLSLLVWDRPDFLISSDSLLPAEFVWDVVHHSDTWLSFQQARVPSLLPDLLIYGTMQVVTGSWRLAMGGWIFVVLAWLVTIASCITARIAGSTREAATLAFLLPAMLVLSSAVLGFPGFATAVDSGGDLSPYRIILPPFNHGGPFLLALTATVIANSVLERWTAYKIITLSLLSFAGGISDLLWFSAFLVPLTAAMIAGHSVGTVARKPAIRLLSNVWCSGVLGWACAQMLDREPLPFSALYTVPRHIARFLTELGHNPGMMIIVAGCGIALASDAWRRGRRGWLASFWSVFATTAAAGSLALTMVLYEGISIYRYALPFLWWTVILAAAALARVTRRHSMLLRLPLAVIASGLALAYLAAGLHVPRLFQWRLPLASCLESAGLRAGLAIYATARPINAATDWHIQVEQISEAGAARVWGNDRLWYTHDIHDGSRRPAYRFIVMDGLSADRIAAAYGQPDRVMMCDSTAVWIYDDPDRLYRNLVRASPSMAKLFAAAPSD